MLSASLDHSVIMWDIHQDNSLMKFEHSAMVTCISFCPIVICYFNYLKSDDEIFVSGCFDKIVRIWNPTKGKVVDYINLQEYITAISYFPTGDLIIVGSHLGKCSIYETVVKLKEIIIA